MIQSRIREIRRAKGLTLQQVGERAGTTAQTIGRLETGMRTLSINWVQRIAKALDSDPSALLSLPESGDVSISGSVDGNGIINEKQQGTLTLRLSAIHPIAITFESNLGQYQKGDNIVCDEISTDDLSLAHGRDCLVRTEEGKLHFTKVLRDIKPGKVTLAPISSSGSVIENCGVEMIAPAVTLIRNLQK